MLIRGREKSAAPSCQTETNKSWYWFHQPFPVREFLLLLQGLADKIDAMAMQIQGKVPGFGRPRGHGGRRRKLGFGQGELIVVA